MNLSTGLSKAFPIHERLNIRINASFTNVLNHTNLADPILSPTNANFGRITSAAGAEFGGGRTGQVVLPIEF